jgi:hypothetical protein
MHLLILVYALERMQLVRSSLFFLRKLFHFSNHSFCSNLYVTVLSRPFSGYENICCSSAAMVIVQRKKNALSSFLYIWVNFKGGSKLYPVF